MRHTSGGNPPFFDFFGMNQNDEIDVEIDLLDPRAIASKLGLETGRAAVPQRQGSSAKSFSLFPIGFEIHGNMWAQIFPSRTAQAKVPGAWLCQS